MSRRRAATGLAAGLAIMVAAPVIWWVTQPEPAGQTVSTVNAAAVAELASPPPVTSGVPGVVSVSSAPPSPLPSPHEPTPTETVPPVSAAPPPPPAEPAPPAQVPPPVAVTPIRIEVPALGVDTIVVPVGVDSAGLMEVPEDVDTVGWYRFGPAPGAAAGSAVLSGHVDDYRQGPGAFAWLGDLGPGDVVRVVDEAGVSRDFSVLSREQWNKGGVPLDRLFDRGGASRLVLITCGGSFNSSTLGYDDNIAITAVPISP